MTDKQLFAKYIEKMESFNDDRYSCMADDFARAKRSYLWMKFRGSSMFDPVWITKIEECLFSLDQIVNNPREVTTFEGSVTPIELAKKINYESVQHLASHSQYVKEIDKDGNVIPAKILSQFSKEELHTYENRFIATFIRRLIMFIDKRYEFVKSAVTLDEKEIMYVRTNAVVDGREVEIETKMTVRTESEDAAAVAARDYIERIQKVKEYIGYYYSSPFMKEFKTEKDVRRPINLTNILRKNPLYHKCYETFLFIERFDSIGVSVNVERDYFYFNERQKKAINHMMLSNLLFLESDVNERPYKKTKKEYKPKVLTSIDDEMFVYDDLVRGPVEYVRVDDNYVNYLRGIMPADLPEHPIKGERRYHRPEYLKKRNVKSGIAAIDSLLTRTQKRIATFEKKVVKLINTRKIADAKLAQKALKELRAYEQDVLNKIRAKIIAEGKADGLLQLEAFMAAAKELDTKQRQALIEEMPPEPQLDPEALVLIGEVVEGLPEQPTPAKKKSPDQQVVTTTVEPDEAEGEEGSDEDSFEESEEDADDLVGEEPLNEEQEEFAEDEEDVSDDESADEEAEESTDIDAHEIEDSNEGEAVSDAMLEGTDEPSIEAESGDEPTDETIVLPPATDDDISEISPQNGDENKHIDLPADEGDDA